jgi:hypothetical protein
MSLSHNVRENRSPKKPSALGRVVSKENQRQKFPCETVSLTRKLTKHNTTLVYLKIDPLEEIFVAYTVNLHAFMDEQSFSLLNHWTPST